MKREKIEVSEQGLGMPCTCCDEQSLSTSRAFLAVSIVCERHKQMQLMRLTGLNSGPVLLLRINTGHDFSAISNEQIDAFLKLTMKQEGAVCCHQLQAHQGGLAQLS